MESGKHESENFANSNTEIEETVDEESSHFQEYSSQQADEVFASSIEQTSKKCLLINCDDMCKTPRDEESFIAGTSEVLCKDNCQLQHFDTEGTSNVLANQSSFADTIFLSEDMDKWITYIGNLFQVSLRINTQVPITGNEIPSSQSNVPETQECPPSVGISHTEGNHVCDSDHNYADRSFLNASDNIHCEMESHKSDNNYAYSSFLNASDNIHCEMESHKSDHDYAQKRFLNISEKEGCNTGHCESNDNYVTKLTESIPGPSHAEEIDTEFRNIFDSEDDLDKSVYSHSYEIPYICHVCQRTFALHSAVIDHFETHSAKILHSRPQCDTVANQNKVYARKACQL